MDRFFLNTIGYSNTYVTPMDETLLEHGWLKSSNLMVSCRGIKLDRPRCKDPCSLQVSKLFFRVLKHFNVSKTCPLFTCLKNGSSFRFWSLANQFPDLISRLHVQVRLMGNFGFNGSLPWLQNTDGAICFIC